MSSIVIMNYTKYLINTKYKVSNKIAKGGPYPHGYRVLFWGLGDLTLARSPKRLKKIRDLQLCFGAPFQYYQTPNIPSICGYK